ncbi:MAG: hypothetical protein HPY62_13140 [Bacteroidales bacterium]|nr:hypothetical protein [Bacteroidales bacterium]
MSHIPHPLLFNPLKHYLPFIRQYVNQKSETESYPGSHDFIRELKHLGNCVMDIYKGELSQDDIFKEIIAFLEKNKILSQHSYARWAGTSYSSYRIVEVRDGSLWTLKYNANESRYVHIFPSRLSPHTFRIKANTLKSAILYQVLIGKDYISDDDLNKARALAGLSPVREAGDAEAVIEMIEILREEG